MINFKSMFCFILFFLLFFEFTSVCFAADRIDAETALVGTENALASAYEAVAEVERAGANVSELLVKLEIAGNLLAQAYNAFRLGDYEDAYLYAINASNTVGGVVSEASSLKLKNENAYSERLFLTVAMSSAGLSVLFVLSLFGWRFLKNKYVDRILGMKPERGED